MEEKHRTLSKEFYWVPLKRTPNLGFKSRGKIKDKGKWFTRVDVQFIVGIDGNLEVDLEQDYWMGDRDG